MTASVIKLEALEGIDAEGSPPCQMKIQVKGYDFCGRPAVARIQVRCQCGRPAERERVFVCAPCLNVVRQQGAACEACGARDFAWGES